MNRVSPSAPAMYRPKGNINGYQNHDKRADLNGKHDRIFNQNGWIQLTKGRFYCRPHQFPWNNDGDCCFAIFGIFDKM